MGDDGLDPLGPQGDRLPPGPRRLAARVQLRGDGLIEGLDYDGLDLLRLDEGLNLASGPSPDSKARVVPKMVPGTQLVPSRRCLGARLDARDLKRYPIAENTEKNRAKAASTL